MSIGSFCVRLWSWGGGALHVVDWGDELSGFHETTASTHVFDQDTHKVIKALQMAGCAMKCELLWSAAFGEPATESDCEALEATLETLQQAGLVTATND